MTVCDRLDALVVGWVRFCDRLRSQEGAGIGSGASFVSMSDRLDAPVAGWVRFCVITGRRWYWAWCKFVTVCDPLDAVAAGWVRSCDCL